MRIKIIKPLSLVSLFLQISYLILPVLSYITLTTTAKANSNNYNCVADTFVSLSSTNPSNGTRRFIPIGTYTDYTLPGNPTFAKSRGLLNFGTIELGSNAIVTSAKLIVWHYGTNSGNQAIHVTKATSSWNETTVAPGPNIDGQNYGSTTFPYYNSSQQAVAREINLNTSLVDSLRNPNNGIVLKNFDESARGVVICSNNIPSGPCKSGMQPQLVIDYYLNQPPNQPNLDRPQQGWELGPATDQNFTGITCNNDGTGQGCNVEFRAKADDPDDTFPITNTFEIISQEGASASYTTYNEDWQMWQKVLKDGHWKWRAKSTDAQGAASSWTGYRNFIIDTTAPSQPQMIAMKPYSPGIQNEIITEASHDNIIGQINYNFEKADDEFFTQNLETSGWIESTNYIFANLTDDKKYFYRVRAQDKLHNISSYSNVIFSTQDATSPQIDNVELSNQRISPVNQDGNFDTVEISSEIADKYLSEIEVQIQDDKKNVVRVFTQKDIVEPTKQLSISWNGKDDLSNDVPDGAYKIIIIARDRAGNQSQNEDTIIIVDNEPATLNYNPANGSWFKDEILHITGQSEPDAKLTFSNPSTQETIDINMSDLGHFDIEVNLEPGSNQYTLKATDITGNEVIKNLEYFEEESRPTIEIVTPEALTNVTNLSINLKLQDTGFEDYISGIDTSKLYLSLEHESIGEKVLINNGVNLAQGTIIKDCLDGSGQYGDSNLPYCEYEYQLNEPLQPDGMWLIKAQIKDKAGNESEQIQKTIELDSHTYSELTSPVEGEQFNYSKVTLKGKAERGAILEISSKDADLLPGSDMETFEIEPIENLGRVKVYDCKPSSNPAQDGIKEICNWQVDDFELEKDLEKSNRIKNTLKFTLKDRAQNIDVKELNIYTNLYDISYSIDTDSQYFSPNGDGVQDGINFLNISTDANLSYWEVKITDILGEEIKKFSANGNFAYMPFKIAWDGRDQLGQLIFDGDYYYQLKLISSDGIEIESYKKPIHAVTRLQDSVIITNPNDGDLTTRGVTQVSGQAPLDTQVRICDDVIGMDGQCDFEYLLEVDRFNLFSQVIPLIRLPGESETEHFLTAYAIDRYGNRTIDSNRVKITVTNKPPFKSIEILPVFTGVNNEQDYAIIQKKLDENVEITQEDIASLRSVVLRSNVNFGTNRVKFSFADWTNLETFPPSTQFYNLGWIDGANYTHLYSQLDQSQDYQECQNTYCTWDFYYPIPPIGGGLYEIQFEGVLAEEVQSLSASLLIDGNIPTAPIILDIDKIIDGTNYNTNLSDVDGSWRYYSNSEDIVIKGVADPNSAILISDQNSNFSCTTSTNAIGLFSCEADIKSFLPMVDGRVYNLDLVVVAAKGENTSSSLDTKSLIIDKIAPIFVNASSSKEWYQGTVGK